MITEQEFLASIEGVPTPDEVPAERWCEFDRGALLADIAELREVEKEIATAVSFAREKAKAFGWELAVTLDGQPL